MGEGDGDSGASVSDFGGDTGFGSAGDFGSADGFGSGAGLGGDIGGLGIGFGDIGGFGDLGSFGLEGLFSLANPDIGYNLDVGNFSYGEGLGLDSAMAGFGESGATNPIEALMAKLGIPKGMQQALSILAKGNPMSNAVFGKAGMMGQQDQGKAWGSAALGTLGSMFGGPLGGLAGAALGGHMGQGAFSGLTAPGNAGEAAAAAPGQGAGGFAGMLPSLGSMFAGYRDSRDTGNMLGGLTALYQQNSPYAQALRQQLQRQDAASGRRSQYGPREVELQAKLAQMASNQIPAMSQLQSRQQTARNQMLGGGMQLFDKLGGVQGLKDLFSSGGGAGLFSGAGQGLIDSGSLSGLFTNGDIGSGFNPNEFDWGF